MMMTRVGLNRLVPWEGCGAEQDGTVCMHGFALLRAKRGSVIAPATGAL